MQKTTLFFLFLSVFVVTAGCAKKELIEASGTIEIKEVDVASRIQGRVTRLYVEQGDRVEAGRVLADIDDRVVAAQYEDAKASFDQASEEYRRAKELLNASSITRQRFDQTEAFYLQTKSRLAQAAVMKDEAKVKAPWTGVILQKYVEEGELVSSSVPLFTLGDPQSAKLTIYVTLLEAERISTGDSAAVTLDAFPDRRFPGKVIYISDKAEFTPKNVQTKDERVKEVFAVKIAVPNEEGIFKPGMPADAELAPGTEKNQ